MSTKAWLISHTSKERILLGKLSVDDKGHPVGFIQTGANEQMIATAIQCFLASHFYDDVRLINDNQLYFIDDISDYSRMDRDYGLPYTGPRKTPEPGGR